MKYRKLRIAWSVGWAVAAVLLIVLWVRSYWWTDSAWRYTPNGGMRVDSLYGKIIFKVASLPTKLATVVVDTKSDKNTLTTGEAYFGTTFYAGFLLRHEPNGFDVFIPYWFPALVAIACAPLSWLPIRRFSLRTLLIATTLVAVVLGLIVYAVR